MFKFTLLFAAILLVLIDSIYLNLMKNYISNMFKLNNASLVATETNEIIQDTLPIEEEIIIEPKPKTKVIIKKKVKKPLVIVEDEDVVV